MAISRENKEKAVTQLKSDLERLKLGVMTDYRGLSVAELEELRQILRQHGIDYRVTKNTLLRLAAHSNERFKALNPAAFTGPMALAMGYGDEVEPAKLIFQFAKTHDALEIVGGISADGRLLTPADIKALAALPSREVLYAQLVGTIAAPLSGFVNVLAGNIRGLVTVLKAYQEQKA